jgi:hypothetical protein
LYFFRPLHSHNLDGCAEFISHHFVQDEPTTKHLGISFDEFLPFSRAICAHAVAEDLSVLAFDGAEELVGAVVGFDYARTMPSLPTLSDNWMPVLALLHELDQEVAAELSSVRTHYLPLMAIATKHRSQAFFKELMAELAAKSAAQGFRCLYSQETSEYRFRLASFPGKVHELSRTRYEAFVFAGQAPFKGLAGRCAAIKTDLAE